jgi:hypothetical protein
MRTVLTIAALTALQVAATAQIIIQEKPGGEQDRPAAKVHVAKKPGAQANLFYKAFYLESGARKFDAAIEAYREYLGASPKGHFAPRSAYSLRQLLNRVGREDEAREVGERYKDVLSLRRRGRMRGADARSGGRGDRGGNRRGDRGGNRDRNSEQKRNYAAQLEKLTKNLEATEKALENAANGDDPAKIEKLQKKVNKISNQIKVIQRRMERGDNPRRGGAEGENRGRRRGNRPALKDMSKEDLDSMVERMGRMVDRISQNVDADRAENIEKNYAKFKKLVEAGKLDEAQKMVNKMFGGMRRRR